jgi:hypothetical protein
MDLSKLHKADVLCQLWNRAKREIQMFQGYASMSVEEAQLELDVNPNEKWDYLYGRPLFIDLMDMTQVDLSPYDEHNGNQLGTKIISKMLKSAD